jgi:hypothetical protein
MGFDIVSVMLGNGNGTFQAVRAFGSGSDFMAVGDVNGDGVPDVTAAFVGGHAGVLLGSGDGTFAKPLTINDVRLDDDPTGLTLADFNGDSVLDLAVGRSGNFREDPGDVSVLLGNGDGTFQLPLVFRAGNVPSWVTAGDFNRDGVSDLVVTNPWDNTVSLALGNGDGTFQAPRSFATGFYPRSIAVSDFNTDGNLDLAVANDGLTTCSPGCSSSPGSVLVLLGNGDGTFQPAMTLAGVDRNYHVAAGDFNGDGLPDLAVANDPLWAKPRSDTDSIVALLLGNGDGTFQSAVPYSVAGGAHVAVGDLNGDGKLDLVTDPARRYAGGRHCSSGLGAAIAPLIERGKLNGRPGRPID